jgi:biotin carboxyl carrier protein
MPKKIRFEWEGKNYEVEVERAGDRLTLVHQGKRYVVTLLAEQEPSGSAPAAAQAPPRQASPPPAAQAAAVPAAAPAAVPSAELDAAGALHAPMTGVIREIKVAPGEHVKKDQVVLIMEAMKMDIDFPSPASGVVAEVLVKAGDTVSAQQKLMVIH